MTRKTTFILSAVLTAFTLVMIGAVAGQFTLASEKPTPESILVSPTTVAPLAFIPPTNVPTTIPTETLKATPYPVSAQVAVMIAAASAPGIRVQSDPLLVSYNGTIAYEIMTDQGPIYIDAGTGQVLYNNVVVLPQANNEEEQDDD